MGKKLRVGIVGLGKMGRIRAAEIVRNGDAELVCGVDPDITTHAAFPDRLARLLKANVNLRAADPRIGPWPAAHEVPLLFSASERRANQLAVGLPAKAAYEPGAGDDAAARWGGRPPR
ncbi:MAG: hypothetical protein IIB38_00605 [Candidatus Hydrogenedentes bacterium]|nr:hypothetical protein [Candidatus Hydrogenedentota bacterium]